MSKSLTGPKSLRVPRVSYLNTLINVLTKVEKGPLAFNTGLGFHSALGSLMLILTQGEFHLRLIKSSSDYLLDNQTINHPRGDLRYRILPPNRINNILQYATISPNRELNRFYNWIIVWSNCEVHWIESSSNFNFNSN